MCEPTTTVLYKGSDIEQCHQMIANHLIDYSDAGDLGCGIYVTLHVKEAIEWASRVSKYTGKRAAIVRFALSSVSLNKLNDYHFLDNDELYWFARETGGNWQRRFLQYDYLKSNVVLPISGRSGVQLKFQTDRGKSVLLSGNIKILLFPEKWTSKEYLEQYFFKN